MHKFISIPLLLLTSLLVGCALLPKEFTAIVEVGKAANNGNPNDTVKTFRKYYPKYEEDGIPETLLTMNCAALLLLHEFDEHLLCLKSYEKHAEYYGDVAKSFHYQLYAERSEEMGDNEAAMMYVRQALGLDDNGVRLWELAGMLHARRGEYEKAIEYVKKINDYRHTSFFGLLTVGETEWSRIRKISITRIYLEMGDSEKAIEALMQPLADKSISQYVLEGVVSALESYSGSLETIEDKAFRQILEVSNTGSVENKSGEVVDWGFYNRIIHMGLSARISLKKGAIKQAEITYLKLLKEKNFIYQKPLYFDALKDMGEINYRQGDYNDSIVYIDKAVELVEQSVVNISDLHDQASFVRKRESIYTLLDKVLKKQEKSAIFRSYCKKIYDKSNYLPKICGA